MKRIEILDTETMVSDIQELYEDNGKSISRRVIQDFIEEWRISKYPLYETFGFKLRIEGSTQVKKISKISILEAIQYIYDKKESKMGIFSTKDKFTLLLLNYYKNPNNLDLFTNEGLLVNIESFRGFLAWEINNIGTKTVVYLPESEELIEKNINISTINKELPKIFSGLLLSKAELEGYVDLAQSVTSEIIQRIKNRQEELKLIYSIHPYDYITASFSKWSSCFTPNHQDYAKAVFSLMMDEYSVVCSVPFETLPGKDISYLSIMQDSVYKRMRCFIHFTTDYSGFVVNKLYPNDDIIIRESIAENFNSLLGNPFVPKALRRFHVGFDSTVWDDTASIRPVCFGKKHIKEHDVFVGITTDFCMSCGSCLEGSHIPDWYCNNCDPDYYEEVDYDEDEEQYDDTSDLIAEYHASVL